MRIGASTAENARHLWAAMPALAAERAARRSAAGRTGAGRDLGTPAAAIVPLVAVQRYGRGRSMVFAGEGSWRWKMMLPSTDRSYEFFWRQAARWLAGPAPDPVVGHRARSARAGDSMAIDRRRAGRARFAPVADATVVGDVDRAGRRQQSAGRSGATARWPAGSRRRSARSTPGLYRVHAEARRGSDDARDRRPLVLCRRQRPRVDRSRLNEGVLAAAGPGDRRPLRARGRRSARSRRGSSRSAPGPPQPERRDLWHEPWAFALLSRCSLANGFFAGAGDCDERSALLGRCRSWPPRWLL